MHPVESLTRLYRARYYRHTPDLNRTVAETLALFGDRESIPTEFMRGIKRHGLLLGEGWNVWYEPCPVIKTTAMEVIVISQNLPIDILQKHPDFKLGGKFHINKAKLQRDGKALHTRHGEYFFISAPDIAFSLVESKELVEAIS
jgi:hypothetical protein